MGRDISSAAELEEDSQIYDGGSRGFTKKNADQPKRSPIRRKDKMRQEDGMRPKAKRNHKKIQYRIKYEWENE